jgi:site-specific DNA recombinase
MKRKVALYIRTSTENQKESIRLQQEELERHCKHKEHEIFDKYIDFGFSGSNVERPAFQNLMENAKENKFDMVLVTKIDRFARSILDCLVSIEKLQNYNIAFAATSQPIDTSSAMGKLTLNIMAAFADFEREIIRERMAAGRKAAEKRGIVCNRPRINISESKVMKYINKGLSATATGKILDIDPATIVKRLHEWGYTYNSGEWVKK